MEKLLSYIRQCKDENLKFLSDLVAIDSSNEEHGVYGKELQIQQFIAAKLESMGMTVDIFQPDNAVLANMAESNPGHDYTDRPNVVATLPGTGGGRSLILNGHIDTMPFDQIDQWVTHPLQPKVIDGKLYGRGATDMKGGVAAMILALAAIGRCGITLKGDVLIETVADEEGGGNGTLACIAKGYKADAAIITEPTQLQIMPAHMGWLFYKVEVTGKALHAALKWQGVNAIEKTVKIIQALQELERTWAVSKRSPILPSPTINFGTIHGGMAGSVVADRCVLDFGLHYLPQDKDSQGMGSLVQQEVFAVIDGVVAGDPWLREHPPVVTLYQQGSGYEIPFDSRLIDVMKQEFKAATDQDPVIQGCPYGSDARLLTNYGGTPTVLFGPGSIEQAHSINEFVSVEEYLKSIEILALTIVEWCNG